MKMIVEPAVIDGKMAVCLKRDPSPCRHKCTVH